jgi:succinate dehydrogenase / fumarate reductase, cytochrome b subunit
MTDAPRARPLSPHLQVWRPHVTMITSITHRITGGALYGGALILALWALTLAAGPDAYGLFMGLMGTILGKIIMFGLTFSFFYHLAAGVRHLFWDAGAGFDLKSANAGSIAIIAFTIAATLAVWIVAALAGAV